MTASVNLSEGSCSVTVQIPNNPSQSMRTMYKVAFCAGTVFIAFSVGMGIGCLIANKRFENPLCLENPATIDHYNYYYNMFCSSWVPFMECIQEKIDPNFFDIIKTSPCIKPLKDSECIKTMIAKIKLMP